MGPLRVQKALHAQMASPGKVAIISTGMGSIGDNGSGGLYAYRTSKAAVNMVTKSMACDFKEAGIAVRAINPGMLQTEFGPGLEGMKSFGAKPVEAGVASVLKIIAALDVESTGQFWSTSDGGTGEPRVMEW